MVVPLQTSSSPWEKFMEESQYSPQTVRAYRMFAAMVPDPLTQESVDALIRKHPTPQMRSFLRLYIYEFLKRREIYIPRIRGRRRKVWVKYLARDEVRRLLESDIGEKDKLFIRVVMEAGLRVSEVLRIDKYSLFTGRFMGKGNVISDLVLSPQLRDDLIKAANGSGIIWKRYKKKTVWLHMSRAGKRILGRGVSPHDFRRTFGIKKRGEGKDIYAVKQLLRHSSIVTTQKYFDVPEEEMRAKGW